MVFGLISAMTYIGLSANSNIDVCTSEYREKVQEQTKT